jgi:hypothetical protein
MRLSLRLVVALGLASLLSGCLTTKELVTKVNSFTAGIFNNLSVGAYKATPQQIHIADQRATTSFNRFSAKQKKTFKESGTRYLAVRTADPTPAQQTEIRKNMQKPGSLYSAPKAASSKVYCVMIWDTQTREVVGTDCYAVLSLPTPGTVAHFDTYTAQYVGNL